MPTFNYTDYANEIRNIVCSNPILDAVPAASRCNIGNFLDERFAQSPTFPRIRNNSAYAMDVDSVRNTLEGMTQNAVFGDLAVLRDRQFRPVTNYTTCSNQVDDSTASNPAVSTAECMSQNSSISDIASFLEIDVDSVRYILAGSTRNAVSGEVSVLHERHFKSMPHDYRKWELKRIKNLISSKATVRYIMEVK